MLLAEVKLQAVICTKCRERSWLLAPFVVGSVSNGGVIEKEKEQKGKLLNFLMCCVMAEEENRGEKKEKG